MNPTTVSSTASHQHQQEQEMLASFAVPNPPLSTQQSQYLEDDVSNPKSDDENKNGPRTLWMGDLDPWLDEPAIENIWWQILNKKVQVKVIRPKFSKPDINLNGLSHSGYCFIEFETFGDAKQALSLNGQLLPDLAMPSQRQFPNNPDNQKKYFRLNWASGATLSAPIVQSPEYSLFVGDLSASTTEAHLLAFFQKLFPTSVKTVRVMTDPVSGKSRCFGFVRFTDELERQRALVEMNGVWFGGRPLRVALATPRNQNFQFNQFNNNQSPINQFQNQFPGSFPPTPSQFPGTPNMRRNNYYENPQELMFNGGFGYYPPIVPILPDEEPKTPSESGYSHGSTGPGSGSRSESGSGNGYQPIPQSNEETLPPSVGEDYSSLNSPVSTPTHSVQGQPYNDPNNTTVFVGGLSPDVSEQTLFTLFKSFGIIQQIKIPPGKNCGFVKYSSREEAEEAIAAMQGFIICGNRVRLSWGRVSLNNKKFHQHQHQAAQAAHMQAAAAMSMGMDPASAMAAAAAAAAAAGGYPGMPPQGLQPIPQGIPPPGMQGIPPQGLQGLPPQAIHGMPPPQMQGMPPIPISPQNMIPVPVYVPPSKESDDEKKVDDDNELTTAMKSMNLEK